jgi:hypothetical protein
MSGVVGFLGAGWAPNLTSCRLRDQQEITQEDLVSLAACSELQELELDDCGVQFNSPIPPQSVLHSSALTKLELARCYLGAADLVAVCGATQLRHLSLRDNNHLEVLPSDLSSLQRLTFLDISGTAVTKLPQQLGSWMPQLQVLGMEGTKVAAIPKGLQQLTCLKAGHSGVTSMAAVQHLTGLKQLQLHGHPLSAPCQQLSLFTALLELSLSISEGSARVAPWFLPLLNKLRIKADDPFKAAGQLVGRALHLTSLGLYSAVQQASPWEGTNRTAAVKHLGALPVLQDLVLSGPVPFLRATGPWLLQQPQLTSLSIAWPHSKRGGSQQPWQQQGAASSRRHCDGLPIEVGRLTALRVLRLSGPCTAWVPACVSRLPQLRVLQLDGWCATDSEIEDAPAWARLARMLLLKRVIPHHNMYFHLQQLKEDARHLFWGNKPWTADDSEWRSL